MSNKFINLQNLDILKDDLNFKIYKLESMLNELKSYVDELKNEIELLKKPENK